MSIPLILSSYRLDWRHWSRRLGLLGLLSSLVLLLPAQPVSVSGRVTTAAGAPLTGVTVRVEGTPNGALTDEAGQFSLRNLSPEAVLLFSYIGYKPVRLPLAGQTRVEVTLREAAFTTDEVVVVGYGTQRKSDLTGAISSVKAEDLTRIATGNLEQALQGKVAGVQVTPVSGEPGAGAVVRIRGIGTLNNASPLFVVDGMLLDDISFLNPQDVASVEVLKDASATAIYGSRGANGVIIITTRRGEMGAGGTVQVDASYGWQEVAKLIELADASEYAQLANETALNEGRPPSFDDPAALGTGTDWQDVIFQTAPIQTYQVTAMGATEKTRYYVSGNYFGQEGIIRGGKFQRVTFRVNNEYTPKPWLSLGHNLAFTYEDRINGPNVLGNAYRADPTVPVYDSLGNFSNTSINAPIGNPEAQLFYNNNNFSNGYRTVGNVYADLKFLRHFTFRTNFGLDFNQNLGRSFTPVFFVSAIQQNQESRVSVNTARSQNWLWENTLTFHKDWKNHSLTVLGGITAQFFDFENLGGSRINLPGDTREFFYLSAGELEGQTNFSGGNQSALASYLFRANYSLLNRYLFTVSFRADGSSKFGANHPWGYFPSAAVGWRITDEPFMAGQRIFDVLKLRASYGVIGNEKIGAYSSQAVVTSNLNAVFGTTEALNNGASIITLANPDLRWESTEQADIGLEMAFLANRLAAEVDWYRRITNDILVDVPIPNYVGSANNPVINAAQVLNRGFDFNLRWRDRIGGLDYQIGGVASTVYNEVLALGEGKEEIFGGGLGVGGKLGTRTVVGQPIGGFYGYEVAGVFQTQEEIDASPNRGVEAPGDLQFVDINEDGVITSEDRTYLGSPIPSFIYGFNFSLSYKGVDLVADFNGQMGNYLINAKKMARFGTPNFEASYLDRWTEPGSSDSEPRVTNGGHNYEMSTRFIERGDFFRLRNLQIGYSLPESLISRMGMSRLRVYAGATNLFTRSPYSGYTPEVTSGSVIAVGIDSGVYPIARVYQIGVNLSF
ncbi:MAG: TonB-dependent receptor [Bacteroidetes bacterium]|nr:MAG: TonB-dependent receptor [Bacteroidota bacterium]